LTRFDSDQELEARMRIHDAQVGHTFEAGKATEDRWHVITEKGLPVLVFIWAKKNKGMSLRL
jgi:hypothetical protein